MMDRSRNISRKLVSNCFKLIIERLELLHEQEAVVLITKIKRHLDKKWFGGDPFISP